jgi:hypothetical protein
MTATKTQLIGGGFQDSEGNILANGYLEFYLSQDSSVTGVGNVCAGIAVRIQLDSNGNAASSSSTPTAADQYIWGNADFTTSNTFYRVIGYTAQGQPAWGPNNQQVGTGSTFNLGTWVPNTVLSWTPPVQPLLIEVNGTEAQSQTILNLESTDSSVVITDEGNGNINLQASSGFSAGSNIVSLPPFTAGAGNLGGQTTVLVIPAGMVQATGSSLRVGLSFYNITTVLIDAASIGATLPNPIGGLGGFTYNYAWTTSPITMTWPAGSFLNPNQIYFSNPVSITVDTNHDYYITIYYDSANAADSPYIGLGGSGVAFTSLAGYLNGNHTGDGDASTIADRTQGVVGISQVVIG